MDADYDPSETPKDGVEYWGLDTASNSCLEWCIERTKHRMMDSWFFANIYFTYLLEVRIWKRPKRLNGFAAFGVSKMII